MNTDNTYNPNIDKLKEMGIPYAHERLVELLEEWKATVKPHDRAYLGAVSFLQYIIK